MPAKNRRRNEQKHRSREQTGGILNKPDPHAPLKQRLHEIAVNEKPYLPVNEKDFQKCSSAIELLTTKNGQPLLLPSAVLPPLF